MEQLKKIELVMNMLESLQAYMFHEIWFMKDKKKALLGQPCLIESLEKKFVKQVLKD